MQSGSHAEQRTPERCFAGQTDEWVGILDAKIGNL